MVFKKTAAFILYVASIILCFLIIPAALQSAPAQPLAASEAITADEIQISAETPDRTRFTIFLNHPIEAKTFVIERPNRVVLEIPEVSFKLMAKKDQQKIGAVAAFRYGLFAPGRSRVILELAWPAAVTHTFIEKSPDGRSKLVVDLSRVEQETFHKSALSDAITNSRQPSVAFSKMSSVDDGRPLIMIDPGHGGIDSGARAGDVLEKDIVFSFALSLKSVLEKQGKYRVALTREGDVFIPLDERMNMGRSARADLFISIHADTISSSQIRGFTIYTGSDKATDAESARLAEKENQADAVGGIEVAQAPEEISDILQDLTLRETRVFSTKLASILVKHLAEVMPVNKNPHRMAGFRVLRAPDVPSVLIELGYMSSAKDIDLLLSEEWRTHSAEVMGRAIDQYFSTRVVQ